MKSGIINTMQIVKSQSKIVEKVLRDKEGRLVRARFHIYEVAGRVKARLLDFTFIETLKGAVVKLAGFVKEKTSNIVSYVSTFNFLLYTFNSLFSIGSKPRAPTF